MDIMELDGAYPLGLHGTVTDRYSGGSGVGAVYTANEALTNDFHVYAVRSNPNKYRFGSDTRSSSDSR